MFATNEGFKNDEEFKDARVVEGYHYFAKDEPSRKNVESENIKRTFDFADKHNQSVVHLASEHLPKSKAPNLQQISGKQFEGVLSNFVACKGMPIMILSNLAPQFGLFNGSTCTFEGLLYLPDNANLEISKKDFQYIKFNDTKLIFF